MAIYKVGQRVALRSGKSGEVKRILIDGDMPHETRYQVAMEPDGQLIGIEGINVMRAMLAPHLERRNRLRFTEQESDVLDRYTGPTFKEWNRALRSGKPGIYAQDIALLTSALGKIKPKFGKQVYRGLLFSERETAQSFLKGFVKGERYVTPQFMSTSESQVKAYGFAGGNHGVFIKIVTAGKQGAPLRPVTGSEDMGEREVLFAPGSSFTVHENHETKLGEVKYHITLLEDGGVIQEPFAKFTKKDQ
jgi:hypothetical protein